MTRNHFIAFWVGGMLTWGTLLFCKLLGVTGQSIPWLVACGIYAIILLGLLMACLAGKMGL